MSNVNECDLFELQELVLEKETRIRETMLMMGLKQWVLWSTWYLKQFLFLLFSIVVITVLVKVSLSTICAFVARDIISSCPCHAGGRGIQREQHTSHLYLLPSLSPLNDLLLLSCQVRNYR